MKAKPVPKRPTLLWALVEWCEPLLVEAVRVAERGLTGEQLLAMAQPKLTSSDEWCNPFQGDWMVSPHFVEFRLAWAALERDFRSQIEREVMFLEGVEFTETYDAGRQALRGAFAAEFKFDFDLNTIQLGKKRYTAVTVSRAPSPPEPAFGDSATTASQLGVDASTCDVALLDPAFIAALLERHADLVCQDVGVSLLPANKVSAIALIATKMRHRARAGELSQTLAEEADWLARWGKTAAPSYAPVTPKTVKNRFGSLYRKLKSLPQSQ